MRCVRAVRAMLNHVAADLPWQTQDQLRRLFRAINDRWSKIRLIRRNRCSRRGRDAEETDASECAAHGECSQTTEHILRTWNEIQQVTPHSLSSSQCCV